VLSRWSSVLWPPPTSHPASPWTSLLQLIRRTISLYQRLRWLWTTNRMRSPLFHRLLSQHPAPRTPKGPSRLLPGPSPLPWPSLSLTSSAPSGSHSWATISTLQDSLYPQDYLFVLRDVALLSFLRRILRFSTTDRPGAPWPSARTVQGAHQRHVRPLSQQRWRRKATDNRDGKGQDKQR
jgi:hypothetical protein